MIFQLFKWHFDINWYKFEKRWADVFQIYPNAIHFIPPQFCPSLSLLSFPVFCLSSSIILSRYFVISVNSMTIWSVLKLPKIAWPSPFKIKHCWPGLHVELWGAPQMLCRGPNAHCWAKRINNSLDCQLWQINNFCAPTYTRTSFW